ncbi:MAG: SBBP repeat-containing protein, partial [Halioglobus sp.]|nr:SBBP repeat-containing protein [Halioglobus sp.]
DSFVTKLNASGTALEYSTYIGGAEVDLSTSIAVDGAGNAYITGQTGSNDFPVTQGALDISFGGGYGDVFVMKFNPLGTALDFSTYLGESEQESASAIALDALGNGYVTGRTRSNNFPITPGAFQSSNNGGNGDAFVSKINFAIPDSVQRNDFDGDGDSDLLLVNQDGTVVSVLIQDSVYQSHGFILLEAPATGWTVNSTGDINGDKKADILLYNTITGEYRLVTMDGTTVLTDNVLFSIAPAVGVEPRGMGDFDGNGEDEVLIYQPATGIVALAYLAGGAFSSFEFVTTVDVPNNWTLIEAADFTRDSKTDLLIRNTITGETAVIEMDGSTAVATTSLFTIDPAAGLTNVDTADFNADGKTDILMLHTSGALAVVEMNGLTFQSIHVAGGLQLNEELVNAGLYDGDNKSDFLFHNTSTGDVISGIQDGVTIITFHTVLDHLGPASGWTFHKGH